MLLSDSQKMRAADQTAIRGWGIPSTLLMRTAAEALAAEALERMGGGGSAVVFCGSGNNGGDGVAAAAWLLRHGCRVRALLTGRRESMTADTREMERRLEELGGRLEDFQEGDASQTEAAMGCDILIDAVFGIGLNRPVEGRAAAAIALMNASPAPVVAADIPSGVSADTGAILGQAVRAAVTVTFSMAKPGHFVEPGCTCCGQVKVADIGIPREVLESAGCGVRALLPGDVTLPRRAPLSHKGNYGKLLLLGGCVGYTGAPTLCARAAVRSGAGLVYLGVPESIYSITAVKNDEAMPFPLPGEEGGGVSFAAWEILRQRLEGCDVCAAGPGLGRGAGAGELVRTLVRNSRKPLVLDADALFALSRDMDCLKQAQAPVVLTPHEGEFLRMGGRLTGDRLSDARGFAREYGCVLVLKGHRTLAAFPDGEVCIVHAGNPGMAKGGSGDVLTGILAAMLGQLPLKEAVCAGIYLHGYAGDLAAERWGEYAMTAGDVIETLPRATKQLIQQE